jgi:hypothetical protein
MAKKKADSGQTGQTPKRKPINYQTPRWQEVFLKTLAATCNVGASCKQAGIARCTAYEHRGKDPKFAEAWDDSLDDAVDMLEGVALRMAAEKHPTMLIFLLKANRPEKYRDNYDVAAAIESLARKSAT